MIRVFPICGQVKDVNGIWWDVCDVRLSKHGFDLCFGIPASANGVYNGGRALIATPGLRDFWDVNRTKGHGFLFELPAGRTTLKRMRRRLGFNFDDDLNEFWQDRIDDLSSLAVREFAAKHEVNVANVFERRLKTIGRTARQFGWWRKPRIRKILLSDLTLIRVGKKLGISTTHAHRLRNKAKLELR